MKALNDVLPIGTKVRLCTKPDTSNAKVVGYAFLYAHPQSQDAWLAYCVEYQDTSLPAGEQTRVDLFGRSVLETT